MVGIFTRSPVAFLIALLLSVGSAAAGPAAAGVPATGVPATGVPATGVPATGVPATGSAAAAPAANSVQSLRYGTSLFYLYQGEYFESLTELMVGQELAQLGPHADSAELLRGGISLSYGMDIEAEAIFQALLREPRSDVDRDRAWFYLARLAWQRGELGRAGDALAQVGGRLSPLLADEANYLRASLALRQGDFAAAESGLKLLPEDSSWRQYLVYNLGAFLAAQGQWDSASLYFRSLRVPADSEELKSLQDRAFTASGYAQMAAGYPRQASVDFRKVRLESPVSDRALLGYGWAALESQDALSALSPWQVLRQKPPANQSVRESLLAIPYAYEQLGRDGLALGNYRQAADILQSELEKVRQAQALFATGDIAELLQTSAGSSEEWLFGEDILPISPEAPYLQQLIASDSFQVSMKGMRDLQRIDAHLSRAEEKLQVLDEADGEQQSAWTGVIELGGRDALQNRLAELEARKSDLARAIERAEAEDSGRAFADPEREYQWQIVDKASRLAQQLDDTEEQRELLRLYRGLLIWDDSEQFPAAAWRARRELGSLEQLLAESTERMARLDQSIASRRQSAFAPRIADLRGRVARQQSLVEVALVASETELRQVAVAELELQARALSRSLGQSRLAIARLYDRGSTGRSP